MKKNYIADLRYCQKIKQSQSFKQADGLQKKVRKRFIINDKSVFDAEKQMRQIMCFWKEDWDYEHCHSVFLNPQTYYPIVTMSDPEQQTNGELKKYALMMKRLIERLKVDQENEVNYKISERKYVSEWQEIEVTDRRWKYFKVGDMSNQNLLTNLNLVTKAMVHSIQNSLHQIQQMDYCLDSDQIYKVSQIKKELMFITRIFDRHLTDQNQMQEQLNQTYLQQKNNLSTFVANVISILDQMKQQNHGPSFISVQPQIGQLTYILHPLLWAISALFQKEKIQIQKINQFQRQYQNNIPQNLNQPRKPQELDQIQKMRRQAQSEIWKNQKTRNQTYLLDIKDSFKRQNQKFSKIVFLNLDGFESEYNLQVARNFSQNLIYISFPKFPSEDMKQINAYEQRFYNKIMFEKTKLGETFSENQELDFLLKQQRFTKSPEQYHENIQKLYKENHQTNQQQFLKRPDRNQKIFVFPIKMNCLFEKHHEDFPQQYRKKQSNNQMSENSTINKVAFEQVQNLKDVAQQYESHFIRFIMRRYLYNQIIKFRPSHVIISYSNRINIEDSHFTSMIQQLTNIGRYKVMLFPNFTTSYINEIKLQTQEKEEEQEQRNEDEEISNCYSFTNQRLLLNQQERFTDPSLIDKGFDSCPLTLSFFSKILRFLKISSGTYNLQQSFQNQSLSSKLKNIKVYPYTQFLFNILSGQYSQLENKIDKGMLRADKVFLEDRMDEEKDQLKKCIPKFYKDLFQMLQMLVIHGLHGDVPLQTNDTYSSQTQSQHLPSPYTLDVRRIFQSLINIKDKEGIKRIRNYNIESIQKPFNQFIQSEEKDKMDTRYHQKSHLYFKIRSQVQEYQSANQGNLNLKSNNSGLRIVTFKMGKDKILPIYKDTSILFETNQIGKTQTFILVMNHLGMQDEEVKHYIGKISLTQSPSFHNETCQISPINFYDGEHLIPREKFKAKCEWNYKQTGQYLILYWPSQYDFIKASLFKMVKQHYEPRICHQILIAKKKDFTNFYKTRIIVGTQGAQILPRRGCSAYELNNNIFIFGGVYERQHNYLNLQHDIVTFHLNQNIQTLHNSQITLKNVKKPLYSHQYLNQVAKDSSKTHKLNSFIRPKIQIEFFQAQDICTPQLLTVLNQQNVRTVIMIGGYGQNFIFPHSLLTYFYHIIKFNTQTNQIISIQKRNTIDKPIPINLKELVKNKHIFQHFHIYDNETMIQGVTRQDHYFFHRAAYSLCLVKNDKKEGEVNDVFDLSFKFMLMYATELFNEMERYFIRFAQKTGERRVIEESQGSKVEIINGCNNNLFITNQDGAFLYSLNYKQQLSSLSILPLTHQAIISLDVNTNIVSALIKHKQYTKDKCVIASQKIQLPDPKFTFQNQNHYINLVNFQQLQSNFELHVLFMMKRNQLILVHGLSFSQYQVFDQIITTKYTKAEGLGEISKERSPQVMTPSVSLQTYYECTSFLGRENQRIHSVNLLSHNCKQLEFIYVYKKYFLDMNSQNREWREQFEEKLISFYVQERGMEIYLGKVRFIEMRQSAKNKLGNSVCIVSGMTPLQLSLKQYYFNIDKLHNQQKILYKQKQIIKIKLSPIHHLQNYPKISWKKIYKNQSKYEDCSIKLQSNLL